MIELTNKYLVKVQKMEKETGVYFRVKNSYFGCTVTICPSLTKGHIT